MADSGRLRPTRRELGVALAGGLAALPGCLPGAGGAGDPVALLAWLAFAAPALGFACGAGGLRPLPLGLVPPGLWLGALALLEGVGPRERAGMAGVFWAALVLAGLFALGLGLGATRPGRPWAGAGVLLCLTALLGGLPVRGGLTADPWAQRSPQLGRVLYESAPITLVMESAGLDWARAGAVYRAAGTDWLPPERRPYCGSLAGPAVFVVGCAVALIATRRRGRRSAPPPNRPERPLP